MIENDLNETYVIKKKYLNFHNTRIDTDHDLNGPLVLRTEEARPWFPVGESVVLNR